MSTANPPCCRNVLHSLVNMWPKTRSALLTYADSPWRLVHDFRYEIVSFLISCIVFFTLSGIHEDRVAYLKIIISVVHGERYPPFNLLYYLTVWAFAFFTTSHGMLAASQIVVQSLAVAFKIFITKRIMYEYAAMRGKEIGKPDRIGWAAFLLAFAFSLPSTNIVRGCLYYGSATPNNWLNATTIFLMPAALLLFWTSFKQLIAPSRSRIWLIGLLAIVNILIKNNFFLVFAIVWPVFLIRKTGLGKTFWENVLPVYLPGALVLCAEGVLMALSRDPSAAEGWGISIDPFRVWSYWQPIIPLGIVSSLLFPLTYVLFYPGRSIRNVLQQYAFVLMIAAFAIYAVFAETGPQWYCFCASNFGWQQYVCSYLLFMVTLMLIVNRGLPNFSLWKLPWKDKVLLAVFTLHVLAGIVYLARIVVWWTWG